MQLCAIPRIELLNLNCHVYWDVCAGDMDGDGEGKLYTFLTFTKSTTTVGTYQKNLGLAMNHPVGRLHLELDDLSYRPRNPTCQEFVR